MLVVLLEYHLRLVTYDCAINNHGRKAAMIYSFTQELNYSFLILGSLTICRRVPYLFCHLATETTQSWSQTVKVATKCRPDD